MKKSLLLAIAVAAGAVAFAAGPYQRTAGTGGFKAITPRAAMSRPAKAPAMSVAEASDNAVDVPFTHPLIKNDPNNALWTYLDANGDGKSWNIGGLGGYSVCMGKSGTVSDDWAFSPAVNLKAGITYKVSYEGGGGSKDNGTLALYMGQAATAEGMTTTLVAPSSDYPKGTGFIKKEADVTVAADGAYYFGIHCTTDGSLSTVTKLKNFSIEIPAPVVDAPAVGTIAYAVHPKGEMLIDVEYTAPTKTQSGATLTAISKIELYNWVYPNAEDKVVVENAEPGKTYKATVKAMQGGNNRIRAVAYTDDTAGDLAETKSFFAGIDMPADPSNIRATLSDDFTKVTLTWEPVSEVGENGGYVNPDEVKYYIFDAFGSYYDPALAEEVTSPYTFDYSAVKDQDFMAYQITAGNTQGYSMGAYSNVVVIGKPATTPWNESFTDCYYGAAWMQDLETSGRMMTGLWYDGELQTNSDAPEGTEPEYMNSHDLDNGFLLMLPYQKDDCFGLNSVKVDISSAAKPVFEFYYQGKGSQLEALVARGEEDFESVRTIDLKAESTSDWTLCRVPLDAYKTAKYIRVGFRMKAIHNTDETTWSVPVDNFRVIDLADVDMRLTYANMTPLEAGKQADVKISMENMGTATAKYTSMMLYIDSELVEEKKFDNVAAGQVISDVLHFTPGAVSPDKVAVYCTIGAMGDADFDNNDAGPMDVAIKHSGLPSVTDLAADKPGDNKVQLSWTAPEYAHLTSPVEVTDDFESTDYPDFDAVKAGDWTFNDLDRIVNYTFADDYDNPYRGIAMGFQIFNYKKAGLPEEQLADMASRSGERMMVAWSCDRINDNWLISPELSGNAQTVKFWAKSFTSAFPEEFEVQYSTTDTKPASFQYLEGSAVTEASEDWTEYTALLPEGAKYFAIRHTSYDTYALFVDDITYEAPSAYPADLALTGYNVYRDGLAHKSVTETAHIDEPGVDGKYAYRVSAVYNHGESRACEATDVDFAYDAVADLAADGVSVDTDSEGITVTAPAGTAVSVTAADGRLLFSGAVRGVALRIPATAGVYMVSAAGRTLKAVVR